MGQVVFKAKFMVTQKIEQTVEKLLKRAIIEELQKVLAFSHGQFLLYLGEFYNSVFENHEQRIRCIRIAKRKDETSGASTVIGLNKCLPICSDSIDVLVAAHLFDYNTDPKILLNEIWRTLAPFGKVIIVGFNRKSFLAISKSLQYQKTSLQLQSFSQLRASLEAYDFQIEQSKTFFFAPPLIKNGYLWKLLNFLDRIGTLCCPDWGSCYLLVATKLVVGMRPLRIHSQWTKPILNPKTLEPTV